MLTEMELKYFYVANEKKYLNIDEFVNNFKHKNIFNYERQWWLKMADDDLLDCIDMIFFPF